MSIIQNIAYCLTFVNLVLAAYDTIRKKDDKTVIRSLWLLIAALSLLLVDKSLP
ncbi:MAG: hypothetical protein AAB767_02050 [Patescibacteria group bacterium]